jgi:hypothetical protein
MTTKLSNAQMNQLADLVVAKLRPTAALQTPKAKVTTTTAPKAAKGKASKAKAAAGQQFVNEVVLRHGDQYVALAAAGNIPNISEYGIARAQVALHYGITSKPALKEFARKHALLTLDNVIDFADAKGITLK